MSKTRMQAFPILLALGVSLCQAQPAGITRVEEDDPNITYLGTWVVDTMGNNSAGRAVVLNQAGARASLSFTGTGITWIGATSFDRGVARVFLDGTVNTVDTYSAMRQDQQALFVAKGLSNGTHLLAIEVTPTQNANSAGSGIGIDAFDIVNGVAVPDSVIADAGYFEQNNPVVRYIGNWYLNNSSRASGGSAVLAVDPGSTATVVFHGTGITWIGFRDQWSGLVKVFMDGRLQTTLDTSFLPFGDGALDDIWQRPIWQITDLPNGTHVFALEVLGKKGPNSSGAWVWIDAFRVIGPANSTP
jgi:hypothetical protein